MLLRVNVVMDVWEVYLDVISLSIFFCFRALYSKLYNAQLYEIILCKFTSNSNYPDALLLFCPTDCMFLFVNPLCLWIVLYSCY